MIRKFNPQVVSVSFLTFGELPNEYIGVVFWECVEFFQPSAYLLMVNKFHSQFVSMFVSESGRLPNELICELL